MALREASVVYLFESGVSINQICTQTGLYFRPAIHQTLTKHLFEHAGVAHYD